MSSNENVQIVQKGYADFSRGDIPALLSVMDDNVEWVNPGKDLPTSGTWSGKTGVAEFFKVVGATWDFQAFEPKEYIASGDRVVALGSYTATVRSNGRRVSSDWVMVWKLRDGKVTHFQEYTDTAAIRDALGNAATA